jgi:hypothetical protein
VVTRRRPGRRHTGSPKTAKQNPLPQPTAPGSSLGLAQFRPSSHLAFQARFFTYGSHPGCAAVVLGGGARACVYGVPLRPWQFSFVTPNIKRSLSPFTHKARCATQQHTGVTHTKIRWCIPKESTVEPGARHLQTVQAGPSGPSPTMMGTMLHFWSNVAYQSQKSVKVGSCATLQVWYFGSDSDVQMGITITTRPSNVEGSLWETCILGTTSVLKLVWHAQTKLTFSLAALAQTQTKLTKLVQTIV